MKMLSLFSGIGGMDLAARWAGIETVAFCEIDKFCQKVLRKNFGEDIVIFDDVRTLTAESFSRAGIEPESISMVAGGFPCQDISAAGKGEGITGERSGLWFEFYRLIKEIRPRFVLAENVPALRTRGADTVLSCLEEADYTAGAFVVGAWTVGAPHRRDRVFIVAMDNARGAGAGNQTRQVSGQERQPNHGLQPEALRQGNGKVRAAGLDSAGVGDTKRISSQRRGNPGELARTSREVQRDGEQWEWIRNAVDSAGQDGMADTCKSRLPEQQHVSPVHGETLGIKQGCQPGRISLPYVLRWVARPNESQYEWEAPRVVQPNGIGNDRGRRLKPEKEGEAGRSDSGKRTKSSVGDSTDGIPRRLAGNRVAKLKALGNAVVPQQVYPILKAINDYERQQISKSI